jgi:predicted O-methyltransferase YrrM
MKDYGMNMIKAIENYAHKENIPIMEPSGINFLTSYIKKNKVKDILEIGSAIGYSAIKMVSIDDSIKVLTVERDEQRYNEAIKNIDELGYKKQIDIRLMDAFDLEIDSMYDLIFIDAAKAQSIKFFQKFQKNLKKDGVIITDNINFHGLTHTKEPIKSRNVRQLVRKINNYIDFLENNEEFETKFYEIGDGITISKRFEK